MFKDKSRSEDLDDTADMIEIKDMMYEDELLLSYIDNEELPPFLAEKLEPNHSFLFYSGCVIAEIRDYRQSYPADCDTHYVLLRPTLQVSDKKIFVFMSFDYTRHVAFLMSLYRF